MSDHFEMLEKLIDTERLSEITEMEKYKQYDNKTIKELGISLFNLKIIATRTGLYGKSYITFSNDSNILPSNKFRIGDLVKISSESGSIVFINDRKITISLEEELMENERFRIDLLVNDVHYERMKKALNVVRNSALFNILDGKDKKNRCELVQTKENLSFLQILNEPQKDSVRSAVAAESLFLIHGPPGTGKTTVLVEIINQLIRNIDGPPKKLLVCAPSNIAIDNLIERTVQIFEKESQKFVRVGNSHKIQPHLTSLTLEERVKYCESGLLCQDIRDEIEKNFKTLKRTKDYVSKKKLYEEIRYLRKDLKIREKDISFNIIRDSSIVFSTLSSSGSKKLSNFNEFDVVIIDEAAQATEPECLIAAVKGKKLILAGDQNQLPPVVKCNNANGLSFTLFDRLYKKYPYNRKLLSIQHRMNEKIMNWSSNELYEGKLEAFSKNANKLLCDLDGVSGTEETKSSLFLIDTVGCNLYENSDSVESKFNEGEANIVEKHVKRLIDSGVKVNNIAIISPYNAQVDIIKNKLKDYGTELEIGTVDGFQGREKEAIVISLVRSNDSKEHGFLKERRRLNVAITRAKHHVCLICDSETVSNDDFLSRMIDYFIDNGEVAYAYQYE